MCSKVKFCFLEISAAFFFPPPKKFSICNWLNLWVRNPWIGRPPVSHSLMSHQPKLVTWPSAEAGSVRALTVPWEACQDGLTLWLRNWIDKKCWCAHGVSYRQAPANRQHTRTGELKDVLLMGLLTKMGLLLLFSHVWLFATLWTSARQASLSLTISLKYLPKLAQIILEWVAMPSSRGSSQLRNRTQISLIAGGFFTVWATREVQESGVGSLPLLQGNFPP